MVIFKFAYVIPHIVVFSSPIIYATAFSDKKEVLNFDGSSTMYPVIQKIMSSNKEYRVNIQNSGTNNAMIKTIHHPEHLIAMSSQKTNLWSDNGKYKQKWTDNKMKTIVLAQDAIFVLYKKPTGCNDELVLDEEKFKSLYSIFTRHQHSTAKSNSYKDLSGSTNDVCDKPIIAFARNGGAKKSGTAYSFVHSNPWFDKLKTNSQNQNWSDKIIGSTIGNWLDPKYLKFTQENNKLAYENFDLTLSENNAKMIYLSGAFVLTNIEEISKRNYHIAAIKRCINTGTNDGETVKITKSNFTEKLKDYGWIRDLSIVYSEQQLSDTKTKIIQHLIDNRSQLKEMFLLPTTSDETVTTTSPPKQSSSVGKLTK